MCSVSDNKTQAAQGFNTIVFFKEICGAVEEKRLSEFQFIDAESDNVSHRVV